MSGGGGQKSPEQALETEDFRGRSLLTSAVSNRLNSRHKMDVGVHL